MEINNINSGIIKAYKNSAAAKTERENTAGKASAATESNVDKLEFDAAKAVATARANIVAELGADLSADQLQGLRQLYSDNNVPISPEELSGYIFA